MYKLPEEGFIRIPQIIGDKKANPPIPAIYPISKAQLWKLVKEGNFPKPIKLAPRITAWRVDEIREFIELKGGNCVCERFDNDIQAVSFKAHRNQQKIWGRYGIRSRPIERSPLPIATIRKKTTFIRGVVKMDFSEIIQEVKEAMLKNSIVPPEEIIIDGHFHRFHIQGSKAGSKDGWYIIYHDVIPCGAFGDWMKSQSIKWCFEKQLQMSKKERAHYKLQMAKAMRQHIAVRLEEQAKAAMSASSLYLKIPPANPQHSYLSCKRIRPFFARKKNDLLVLPIRDFSGKLWSLQFINSNGKKWFLHNGAISGHFIPIQLNPIQQGTKILLCEGYATGATLASACPDACVIAACNAGNLKPVAINIRQQLPDVTIVICADDDRLSLKNIGVVKGQEAAIAVGGYFIKPEWPEGSPNILTDFNDLECWLLSQEEAAA